MSKTRVIPSALINNNSFIHVLIIRLSVSLNKAVYVRDELNAIYRHKSGEYIDFYLEGTNKFGRDRAYIYNLRMDVVKEYANDHPGLLIEIGSEISELLNKYELQTEAYE